MNLIDLVAICPFYISLILEGLEDFAIIGKTGKIIRLVRMLSLMGKLQCFLEQGNAPQTQRRDILIIKKYQTSASQVRVMRILRIFKLVRHFAGFSPFIMH